MLLGAAIMLAGLAGVITGEWQLRQALRRQDAFGGPVIAVTDNSAHGDLQGQLVHAHGTLSVERPARDRPFGVVVDTPLLERKVEMQQWRELEDVSGRVTYVRNWFDHPIDSASFKQPAGHDNPPFPFHDARFKGGDPRVAGLLLGGALRQALPGKEPVQPDFSTLPSNLTASFRLADGMLWSGLHPRSPQLGDLRLSWNMRPLLELSILARVEQGVLVPSPNLPAPGYVIMVGDMPADTMLPGLPVMPRHTWLWRVLGMLLAIAGLGLAVSARVRRLPRWQPVVAAAVLPLALVAGALWLGVRGGFVLGWWLLALLAAAVLLWPLRGRFAKGKT